MEADKQILEMAKHITIHTEHEVVNYRGEVLGVTRGTNSEYTIAKQVYDAGYRKASDVAREIFDDIERLMFANRFFTLEGQYYHKELKDCVAELKKKYLESENE